MFPYKDTENLSLFEQLQLLFDDEGCKRQSVSMFCYLKWKDSLRVTIVGNDIYHLGNSAADAFRLGNALFKLLSPCWSDGVNLKNLDKSKFDFGSRGESAVFQEWRNIDASIFEIQVKTNALDYELLYWNKDKIFVINFVPEFDEEYAVSKILKSR